MSKWTEKFNSHPLIGVWDNLLETVNKDDFFDDLSEAAVEDVARIRKVVAYLDGIFKNFDPEITPFNHLSNIQKSAQSCINELNSFKGNKNTGHLQNANDHLDTLLIQFQQNPASNYSVEAENIRESVSAYSETISQYISKIRAETERTIKDIMDNVESLNSDIEDKKSTLSALSSQLREVEQTIQKQASEFNSQYQNSEKERESRFSETLDSYVSKIEKIIDKYSEKVDKDFENLSIRSGKIIEVLTKLQDDASKVYGVTINTLQSGAYSSYANDERKSANRYRYLASLLMIFGVSFLIVPEIIMLTGPEAYNFDWTKVLGRIPLSLAVFVPAFYFARESGKHRQNEIVNRRRQHILSTLDPYVELMKPEKAEELKIHVAKTVFSEISSPEKTSDETSNILSQLANLAKQIKGG